MKIIGNIKPEDDYTHELGPEENFNESVYFNFFDRAQNRGGFVRIGNRANEGYAEMTVIVWNPDGSALFNCQTRDIQQRCLGCRRSQNRDHQTHRASKNHFFGQGALHD